MKTKISSLIFLALASLYFPSGSSIEPQKGRWICTISGAGKASHCFWQK